MFKIFRTHGKLASYLGHDFVKHEIYYSILMFYVRHGAKSWKGRLSTSVHHFKPQSFCDFSHKMLATNCLIRWGIGLNNMFSLNLFLSISSSKPQIVFWQNDKDITKGQQLVHEYFLHSQVNVGGIYLLLWINS